jgi:hypothetical protein
MKFRIVTRTRKIRPKGATGYRRIRMGKVETEQKKEPIEKDQYDSAMYASPQPPIRNCFVRN